MNLLLQSFGILHWMCLGIGAAILGLLALVIGPMLSKNVARYLSLAVLVLLGGLAAGGYYLNEREGAVVLGVFATLWSFGVILQSNLFRRVGHTGLHWVGHARLQAIFLLVLAPTAFGMGLYADQAEIDSITTTDLGFGETLNLVDIGGHAVTDQGTKISLFGVTNQDEGRLTNREREFLDRPHMRDRVIRTGGAGLDTNCHGWVFTAGQAWIKGEAVALILEENDYEEVSSPNADDIAVFRDENGAVTHTALVRLIAEDGLILLESKWGQYGRFIHSPLDQPYGTNFKYYHSSRNGHVLRGIDKGYKPTTPIAHAG